jgi:dUTP pyrophosphatase
MQRARANPLLTSTRTRLNMLRIKKENENATIPKWKGIGNAGLDIHSCDQCRIDPGEVLLVRTGIATEFDNDKVALLRDRSGLALKGLHVLGGVIDSSYRGEWGVVLVNLGTEPYYIEQGERIAQAVFVKREFIPIEEVNHLTESDRGAKGFGSSGRL